MKKLATKYSPRIGELLVEFLDWHYVREQMLEEGQEAWDLDEALEYFGMEKKLTPYELYQIATYLSKKGYPIKAEKFHPETIPSDEEEVSIEDIAQKSIFDQYFNAIKGERYQEAHQIYQRMSLSEKQVIQDQSRRKKSMSNSKKTAQIPDAESAIEKQIPMEPVTQNPQESEMAGAIQNILDQANDLNIPPQLSIPLAVAFDHFKAGQGNDATLNVALKKVLDFLKQQGTPVENIENMLQGKGLAVGGLQKLLRIADIADEQGWFDVTDKIVKIMRIADKSLFKVSMDRNKAIQELQVIEKQRASIKEDLEQAISADDSKMVDHIRDIMDMLEYEEKQLRTKFTIEGPIPHSSAGAIEEAEGLINPTTLLDKFKKALLTDNFEEAEKLMNEMTPNEKDQAAKLASKYHTAMSLKRLFQTGKALFDQKRYNEANVIGKIVRAQMMTLPDDMQGQVILMLMPGGGDLPQAFKNQEEISNKMESMTKRLNPAINKEEECVPIEMNCNMSPAIVAKLLSVADALDTKGLTTEASKIDAWLQKMARIIKAVRKGNCPDCGAEFYYYVGQPQAYCENCRKGHARPEVKQPIKVPPHETWQYNRQRHRSQGPNMPLTESSLKRMIEAAEKEHGGKPAKVVEIADALRGDHPDMDDKTAYKIAYESYCSYVNPGYEGCTEKGKSHRKSPKPYKD
jgi:hypothetical protein